MEKELYSIVIFPNQSGVDTVAKMKDSLAAKLGRTYSGRNAAGCVTVCEFFAQPSELKIILEYVKQFCRTAPQREFNFSQVFSFHTACYIAPDDQTRNYFKSMLKAFKKSFPFHRRLFGVKFSTGAHIVVGRFLDSSQLEVAAKLFDDKRADIRFQADRFVVRKFDRESEQFEDVAKFKFRVGMDALPQHSLSIF